MQIITAVIGYKDQIGSGYDIIGEGKGDDVFRTIKDYPTKKHLAVAIERTSNPRYLGNQIHKAVALLASAIADMNGVHFDQAGGHVTFDVNNFQITDSSLEFPELGAFATKNYFFSQVGWMSVKPSHKPFLDWAMMEDKKDDLSPSGTATATNPVVNNVVVTAPKLKEVALTFDNGEVARFTL